ncbi:MAG: class I SAM-dependent methyltransferase, partial [Bacteroidaceae bacterium]|nr:class I SAM-dependent methyltransferase [Bacteroidaceae bacterium]
MTYKQETIKPYSQEGGKGEQVERMFDSIAHSYDFLNHFLSLGIDKRWRRAAIDSLKPFAPKQLLDVATGTGDFALLAMDRLALDSVLGVDLS